MTGTPALWDSATVVGAAEVRLSRIHLDYEPRSDSSFSFSQCRTVISDSTAWPKDMSVLAPTQVRRRTAYFSSPAVFLPTSRCVGHDSSSRDGSWGGPGNDDAIIDFAWRALHVTTDVAKNLAAQYYGYGHSKSYYLACSTGGRQGIKAMAMFPEDYDGVV